MFKTKKFWKIKIFKGDKKRLIKTLLWIVLFSTALFFGGILGTYIAVERTIPSIDSLENYEPSILTAIYADDGALIKEIGPEKRIVISYDQIPDVLKNAILATEDPRFFKHKGIDMRGILRAMRENLFKIFTRRKPEGGSTITQQLARQLFLHPLPTIQRKLAEGFLAVRIEKKYSKKKIFEIYCNQFSLGHGAFGVEAASHLFFGKNAAELTLEEAAMIAGIFRGPSLYSPYKSPKLTLDRRNHVLNRMAEEGYITNAQAEEAKKRPMSVLPQSRRDSDFGAYFFEEIRRYIVNVYGEDALFRGGMKIYTTMNPATQAFAEEALTRNLRNLDKRHGWRMDKVNLLQDKDFQQKGQKLEDYRLKTWLTPKVEPGDVLDAIVLSVSKKDARVKVKNYSGKMSNGDIAWAFADYRDKTKSLDRLIKPGDVIQVRVISKNEDKKEFLAALDQEPKVEGAFFAEDPRTGQIKAMVGGYSFQRSQLNRSAQTFRQAGSAIKPMLYTAALENGFTNASRIADEPTDFEDKWQKTIWSPKNYDRTYKGMVTLRTGIEESRNVVTARILEHISPQVGVDYCRKFGITSTLYPYLSLALGTFEVSLTEMVSAYTTFPNKGVRIKPYFITRIENREGNILEENKIETEEVISPQTAYLMTYLMQGVMERGTASINPTVMGLLNDKPLAGKTGTTDKYTDAWFIGFSPSLCAGVWVGYDDNRTLGPNEAGAVAALPAWAEFFKNTVEDEKKKALAANGEVAREEFEIPANIEFFAIDLKTGLRANNICKWRFMEAFLSGTEPSRFCSLEDHLLTLDYASSSKAKEER
jgi:penicillin-binding protein 1A